MSVATVDSPFMLAKADARKLVDRINDGVTEVWFLVIQAYSGRAWVSLGYDSWDALCAAELSGARMRLSRDERQDVVERLRSKGLSSRAIGSALGVDKQTVSNDLSRGENSPPEPARPSTGGEFSPPEPKAPPAPVTGLDGKTYTPKPTPSPEPKTEPPKPAADWCDQHGGHFVGPKARKPFTQTAEEARQISNEVWSRDLARCVWLLAGFGMHPGQAAGQLAGWVATEDVYAEKTTPARLRQAATYLTELADAWEAQP